MEELLQIIQRLNNRLYTLLLKHCFASFGTRSVVGYKAANLRGLKHIKVGFHTVIEPNVRLTAWTDIHGESFNPSIAIGDNCQIGPYNHITASNSIAIGNNVLTGPNVLITDNAHGACTVEMADIPPLERPLVSKGAVVVGNNVWIGANACILPGVTIGNGSIIAANCVVTKDVPPYSMAMGVPATIVSLKSEKE